VPRRFVSIEGAAVAGIVCALGWALSFWGLSAGPGLGASAAEIDAFYEVRSNATATVAWLQVLVVANIAFLWFVGVVRNRLGEQEPKLFGTVFLGSSLLLAGLLFVGGTLRAAPSVMVVIGDVTPSPDIVSFSRAAAAVASSVIAPRMGTLVMFSTASLGRATGALPRWLVVVTYVLGAFEFVNVTISTPTVYLLPAWIGLVSVVLLVRHPAESGARS
jgi:hypothetical protein